MAEVEFRHVDVVFGPDPDRALKLLDQGETRETILEQTGHVLGVADATVAIEPGEICVLMGLSGSGKSTLLRCVNRLNKATRGAVLVDDAKGPVDVATCDAATLRRLRTHRIAMVFQQFALLPWRTVQENVGFGLELRGMGRRRARPRGRGEAEARPPRPVARQVCARAVGRHAAAGRARPRLRDRCRHPADGRAVLGARSADPRAPAGRAARAAAHAARRPSCSSATTSTRR